MHLTIDAPTCNKAGYSSFRSTTSPPEGVDKTGFDMLNISGSSQFTPNGLLHLLKIVDYPAVTIVDLRQESHAFVGTSALTFYVGHNNGNADRNRRQLLAHEAHQVRGLRHHNRKRFTAYAISGGLFKKVHIDAGAVQREQDVAAQNGAGYVRLPMTDDEHAPTPETVDAFLEFRRTLPQSCHAHFHCLHGHGRTTLFMVMADMLCNYKALNLDQIVARQYALGGCDLSKRTKTMDFLRSFARFCVSTAAGSSGQTYSAWLSASSPSWWDVFVRAAQQLFADPFVQSAATCP